MNKRRNNITATHEMSRMLDHLMEDARELNVTLIASRTQIEESLRRWGSRKGSKA